MARILIAASPEPRKILERILGSHEFTSAGTTAQATRCLRKQRFDLIVCTILFDESRMLDFLRLVKDREPWAKIPFVCANVKANIRLMEQLVTDAVRFTSLELGAAAYINIHDYKKPGCAAPLRDF